MRFDAKIEIKIVMILFSSLSISFQNLQNYTDLLLLKQLVKLLIIYKLVKGNSLNMLVLLFLLSYKRYVIPVEKGFRISFFQLIEFGIKTLIDH